MGRAGQRRRAYAAVDLGASSGRVMVAVPGDDGVVVTEVHRFPNGPVERGGALLWDAEGLFDQTVRGLARAVQWARDADAELVGIGVDSWGVDYGVLDRNGRFTSRVRHHRGADPAGQAAADALVPAARSYAITGVLPQAINTAFQLRSDVQAGVLGDGETVLLVPDLWVHLLTGETAAERTIASTTQLLDARSGTWSAELLGRWGLDGLVFPPLRPPGSPAGRTTPGVTARIGARAPIPVYRVAGHDTASALAFARADAGELLISSGSWSVAGVCLSRPHLTEAARTGGYTNELGVSGSTLLLRNLAGMWLLTECARRWSQQDGARHDPVDLVRQASAAHGGPAPVIDVGDPRLLAPGDMPQRIAEVCAETGQAPPTSRADTVRCIIESLAAAYAEAAVSAAALTGIPTSRIRIVGGGSRNELLCRRAAELSGLPVLAGPAEASALGNLAVQMVAAGEFADLAEVYAAAEKADPEVRRYDPVAGTPRPEGSSLHA